MIDVLKRLAELDATNPAVDTGVRIVQPNQNISVNESQVDECGMMPMSMDKPHTPATLNISADSGEELGDMLGAIMQLAGLKNAEADHDHGMDGMPADGIAQVSMEPEVDQTTNMRSMIDKLNLPGGEEGDDEETDEAKSGPYDNSPNDPRDTPEFDSEEFAHHENQPGSGDTPDGKARSRFQPATFESLMAEYKQYVAEGAEFGAYYNETLAQKVFDENPNLPVEGKCEELLDAGYKIAAQDLGKKTAQYKFGYDEDFPSDFVSAYHHLQKQHSQQSEPSHDMMEGKMCSGCDKPMKKCSCKD